MIMRNAGGKSLKWLIRISILLLALLAIWLIWTRGSDWLEQIRAFTWDLRWAPLIISVLLLAVSYALIPTGWVLLAKRAGCTSGSWKLRYIWFMSQLGRYVPGKVWLFAGRVAFLKSNGLTGYRSTSVPFLELVYTAAGAGLSVVAPVLLSRGQIFASPALRGALAAAGVALLAIPFLRPLQRWLYRIKYGKSPDDLPLPGPVESVKLLLIYACLWWCRGLVLYLWITGFGISGISMNMCFAAAPLSWLAGYVVFLVPGGIGVREAAVTALVAPEGQTGPFLAIIAGQRLILSVIEVSFALVASGKTGVFSERKES